MVAGYTLFTIDAWLLMAVFGGVLAILFGLLVLKKMKALNHATPFWYLLFLIGGFLNTSVRDAELKPINSDVYFLEILERPIEKEKSYSAKAKIVSNGKTAFTPTHALVYFQKSQAVKQLLPGDKLEVSARPSAIPSPKNPNEFNYKSYLELLNIHSRFYLKETDWIQVEQGSGIKRASAKIQYFFSNVISKFGFPERETAVLQALLIGNRFALSDELTASYASAGAMHVLAVSGLHVGILLLVLMHITKPLLHVKFGKMAQGLLVVFGIWTYAFITGLSPSVLRAATMFTFIYVGRYGKRDVGIYNALLASAFFLLLLQPNLIFQVGFQLSYAAVLGILYLQPKFYKLIAKPKYLILDQAWAITCVSFAAQLATFPFSIYYFHQFPLLFLFSNLIVIVVTYAVMVLGLLFLFLGSFGVFIPVVFNPLHYLVWLMNFTVNLIQDVPNSVVYELSIGRVELVVFYIIIVLMSVGLAQKNFRYLSASLMFLFAICVFNVLENKGLKQTSELTFYAVGKNVVVEYRKGKDAVLLGDSAFLANESKMQFHVKHHLWSQNLRSVKQIPIESDFSEMPNILYRNKTVFLEDERVKIINDKFEDYHFDANDIAVLNVDRAVVLGAKMVVAGEKVSSETKQNWQRVYKDSFVNLSDGAFSMPLINEEKLKE